MMNFGKVAGNKKEEKQGTDTGKKIKRENSKRSE